MSDDKITVEEKKGPSRLVRWGIIAGALLIAFLLGLIPMAMQKWAVQDELAESQKLLRRSEVKGLLTSSIVEAKRGEYEPARQVASSFFTLLNQEQEKPEDASFLKKEESAKLGPIFAERDAVITMLAQRDPAAVERLTTIYSSYLAALGVAQPPTAAPPAVPSPAVSPAESPAVNSGA